jgi:hypothetical protein
MVTHPERQLENLHERIETSEDLSEEDCEILQGFSDRLVLLKSEYSSQRHEKLLRHCTIAAEEVGGLAESLEDRDAAEDLVLWINRNYDNEETNKDYRIALRMFGKRIAETGMDIPTTDNGVPESLAWIPTTTSRNYKPQPDPADMLDWEDDVRPMIDETMNARDAALLAVAWDSGVRSGGTPGPDHRKRLRPQARAPDYRRRKAGPAVGHAHYVCAVPQPLAVRPSPP